MLVIDVIAFVFVTLFTYFSMKKGAVGAALKLAGIIISLFVSLLVYPIVTNVVCQTPALDAVASPIEEAIVENGGVQDIDETIDAMPEFIRGSVKTAVSEGTQTIASAIARASARAVIGIIVFALLASAVRILILLLTGALKLSARLPVIKQCNALIGIVLGLAASLVVLWAASAVICALSASNEALGEVVSDSYVVAVMSLFSPF